jgi:16S rRNA (uracil1498-N3)-methyltransferase
LTVPAGGLVQDDLVFDPDTSHYIARVLRLDVGTSVHVTDGAGERAEAVIAAIEPRRVSARLRARRPPISPSPPRVSLFQAVGKSDKMDAVVRAAAELGVARVIPFVSDRTVARREKGVERWIRIAEDALRVTGRAHRTAVRPVHAWGEVLAIESARQRWVGVPPESLPSDGSASVAVATVVRGPPPETLDLLIGPEGGLTEQELRQLMAVGFRSLQLGPHTLRTETAGPAALAVLTLAWEDGDPHGAT